MATISDFKLYDSVRNILVPDISVDSDLREKVSHWHRAVDSDYNLIRDFESEYRTILLAADGVLAMLDSDSRKAQKHSLWIDSEQQRVSAHYWEIQRLLDSEYIKNRDMLANVTGRLDSDEFSIQAAKTELQNLLDSEYNKNRQ